MKKDVILFLLIGVSSVAALLSIINLVSSTSSSELGDFTGATISDLEYLNLNEGYSEVVDLNGDALPEAKITVHYADNGQANIQVERQETACKDPLSPS